MLSSVVSITRSAADFTGSSSERSNSIASTRPFGLGVERVLAPRQVVSLDQFGSRRIEEDDPHAMTLATQRGDLREHVDVLATGHQRQPLDVAAGLAGQLDDGVDQARSEGCR